MKPYNLTIHVIQSPEEMSVFEAYAYEECEESKEYLEERMKEEGIMPHETPDAFVVVPGDSDAVAYAEGTSKEDALRALYRKLLGVSAQNPLFESDSLRA
tara:strand:+ start:125 stop:424 length:300 start_codon:yes stop_codon:yes gene_type:complete